MVKDKTLITFMYEDFLKVNTKELDQNYRQPEEGKYVIIDVFVHLN